MTKYMSMGVAGLMLATLVAVAQQRSADALVAVLKSDASRLEKVDAAHALGLIGQKEAVAPLAALLDHPELAQAARYGLEMIPDPSVDEALRSAATRLQGPLLVGVLNSIGHRRDAQAVAVVAQQLRSGDRAVAAAAAATLGCLATPEAAEALKPLIAQSEAVAEAYLLCAERMPARYAELVAAGEGVPVPVRLAALRGLMLNDETGARLIAGLKSSVACEVDVALRVAREFPQRATLTSELVACAQNTRALAVYLCDVLACRGDRLAVSGLVALARTPNDPELQLAALRALVQLNASDAVPLLKTYALSDTETLAVAAQDLLGNYAQQKEGEAILLGWLAGDRRAQLVGCELAGRNVVRRAIPGLLTLARSDDEAVSAAALKALGELATAEQLDALISVLQSKPQSEDAIRAIRATCARQATRSLVDIRSAKFGCFEQNKVVDATEVVKAIVQAGGTGFSVDMGLCGQDPAPGVVKQLIVVYVVDGAEKRVTAKEGSSVVLEQPDTTASMLKPLDATYQKASGAVKTALLRVYASFDSAQAMETLVEAIKNPQDPAMREVALRALFDARHAAALVALEQVLALPVEDKMKVLAVRAYLRILDMQRYSSACKIAALTRALSSAQRPDDRKALDEARDAELKSGRDEAGFTAMFNGKDLSGWDSQHGWWFVKEGCLVAQSTAEKPCKKNDHLIWQGGKPGDFEMRVEFRLSQSANSGIQVRAEAVSDRDTGYQADMNGGGDYVGFLYHPKMHLVGGRGTCVAFDKGGAKSTWRFADAKALQQVYKVGAWNSYRVVCKGPEIAIYVNDVLMNVVTDHRKEMPKAGAITLQFHAGPPMVVEYRNLRIRQ